jgi:hypothetical protein
MALDLRGESNPALVRAMAGLCHGEYGIDGACGTLGGALCLLAYYGGKGAVHEENDERLPLMINDLSTWFTEYSSTRFGGVRCGDIVKGDRPEPRVCGGLIRECYERAIAILMENGFDPRSPADG